MNQKSWYKLFGIQYMISKYVIIFFADNFFGGYQATHLKSTSFIIGTHFFLLFNLIR